MKRVVTTAARTTTAAVATIMTPTATAMMMMMITSVSNEIRLRKMIGSCKIMLNKNKKKSNTS